MSDIFTSFAAANGYDGFRSYFPEVFNSRDFSRIYVLKGGPGTGKSSFMKRVKDALGEECRTEEILCSSDPDSLDGLIVERGGERVAIIDGTAPHERDAVIPGAIDEIINLGELWDAEWLIGSRDKILELAEQKKEAYKSAYAYLEIAGTTLKLTESGRNKHFDSEKAKKLARTLIPDGISTGKQRTRLFSAFGKKGEWRLDTPTRHSSRLYSLHGKSEAVFLLLGVLADRVRELNADGIIAPSPLDNNRTESILLRDGTAFVRGGEGDRIDADEFVNADPLSEEHGKRAREIHSAALIEAERWFKIAADLHSRLEKLYTASMNFDKMDAIYDRVIRESEKILSLS